MIVEPKMVMDVYNLQLTHCRDSALLLGEEQHIEVGGRQNWVGQARLSGWLGLGAE